MRSHPANSPQAAARIVALTVVADGSIAPAEVECLDRLAAHAQLGLTRPELHAMLDTVHEDLFPREQSTTWVDACPVDERTLVELMAEVQDPSLRAKVLRLCVALAETDAHVTHGEAIVLSAAVEQWGLHHAMLLSPSPTP